MPEYTAKYGLIKPLDNETADITVVNQNMDTIDGQMKQNENVIAAHLAESIIHAAGGTANALVVTTGGDFGYVQGAFLKFRATAENTGNMSIDIDGKGIKSLKKLDGSQIPAGGIKNGKVFEVYYDAGGDCFFLLARAEGDAVAGDVLAGKTFSNGDDTGIIGTIPNQGQIIIAPGTANIAIPAGYHDGTGFVEGDADLISSNIKAGKSIFGIAGNSNVVDTSPGTAVAGEILSGKVSFVDGAQVTGCMANRGAYNITPDASNITIPQGYHSGAGVVYGDADLVSGNIISGKNIFGVVGSATQETRGKVLLAYGYTPESWVKSYDNSPSGTGTITVYSYGGIRYHQINPQSGSYQIVYATANPIDLTYYSYLICVSEEISNGGGCWFGIATVRDDYSYTAKYNPDSIQQVCEALYIANYNGSYYIKLAAQSGDYTTHYSVNSVMLIP